MASGELTEWLLCTSTPGACSFSKAMHSTRDCHLQEWPSSMAVALHGKLPWLGKGHSVWRHSSKTARPMPSRGVALHSYILGNTGKKTLPGWQIHLEGIA